MKYKINHAKCGKQIAWYIGRPSEDIMLARDYMRFDGSTPNPNDLVKEFCKYCNEFAINVGDLKRDFSESF